MFVHLPFNFRRLRTSAAIVTVSAGTFFLNSAKADYTYTSAGYINVGSFTPAGSTQSRAFSVNSSGEIVGDYTLNGNVTYFTLNGSTLTAFPTVTTPTGTTQLTYDSTVPNMGRLLNDSGNFGAESTPDSSGDSTNNAGYYIASTQTFTQFVHDTTYNQSNQSNPNNNQIATGIRPYAINASNYVVGQQFFETNPTAQYPSSNYHGVIYNPTTGVTTDIGGAILNSSLSAANTFSRLAGISNNEFIVGTGSNGNNSVAFLGTPTTANASSFSYSDLSTLIATAVPSGFTATGSSMATNISANGKYIIGTYAATNNTTGKSVTRAFEITNDASAVDIGSLGVSSASGSSSVMATDVNDSGAVVGYATASNGSGGTANHAVIYSNGTLNDLNSLVSVPNTVFSSLGGISDSGAIVGYDNVAGGNAFNAFEIIATPTPEPGILGLVGSTILLLHRRRGSRTLA